METLLESIRTGIAADASEEQRAAGADACRTILTALDATAGQPLATPTGVSSSAIATAVATLRNVPPDQLLDLAIARLRAALPAETPVPVVQPMKFHVVSLPRVFPARK